MWKNRLKLYTSPESDIIPNNDNVNIDYSRTIYYTLHVFNVLSTFKHYFTQNMMFSSVNTYNFHSNVKEIKKNIDKPTVSTASNGVHDIYTP